MKNNKIKISEKVRDRILFAGASILFVFYQALMLTYIFC